MAKRKNPLKDLDAFLKQEAKNFVQPNKVKETEKAEKEIPAPPTAVEVIPDPPKVEPTVSLSNENVVEFMANLSKSDHKEFYKIVKASIEKSGAKSSEDKMLLNTLLYLNDKENWKENIKEYWS
ncbi:MAG TPA: hypothetical protein PKL31_17590 [Fulvivirga sp.]|nr:hypothetical protein [Fulvivirga sp.]